MRLDIRLSDLSFLMFKLKSYLLFVTHHQVNLLDQIKNQEVKDDIIGYLDNILIK